jgi:hypothetical protein
LDQVTLSGCTGSDSNGDVSEPYIHPVPSDFNSQEYTWVVSPTECSNLQHPATVFGMVVGILVGSVVDTVV